MTCRAVTSPCSGINLAILVNRSTIVSMPVQPLSDLGSPYIKSIVISYHGLVGGGMGCNKPDGFVVLNLAV